LTITDNTLSSGPIRVILLAPLKAVGGISTWTRQLLDYSDKTKVSYHVIDTSRLYIPLGKKLGCFSAILGVRDLFIRLCKLLHAIRTFKPDMVYFTCSPSIGLVIRDAPLMYLLHVLGIPAIAHLRGGDVAGFLGKRFIRRKISRAGLKTCHAILVITREMEDACKMIFAKHKVIYFPNMITDNIVNSGFVRRIRCMDESGPMKIIHVAWQAPEKGVLELVDAMKYVKTQVCCSLVGEASKECKQLIESRIVSDKVEDKICLAGLKRGAELEDIFKQADIFVFPSHMEGFPNVILEAMSYGLPIIASDVGNIREMIGYDSCEPAGLLLREKNPINPQELAKLIDYLAADSKLREHFSSNGRKRVKDMYLATKVTPRLEELLVKLVSTTSKEREAMELVF
jgi:glycosyltransferase involved in cell wall biosynthesis